MSSASASLSKVGNRPLNLVAMEAEGEYLYFK